MSWRSDIKFYFFKSKVVVVGHFIYSLYSTACSQGSSVVSDLGEGVGGGGGWVGGTLPLPTKQTCLSWRVECCQLILITVSLFASDTDLAAWFYNVSSAFISVSVLFLDAVVSIINNQYYNHLSVNIEYTTSQIS